MFIRVCLLAVLLVAAATAQGNEKANLKVGTEAVTEGKASESSNTTGAPTVTPPTTASTTTAAPVTSTTPKPTTSPLPTTPTPISSTSPPPPSPSPTSPPKPAAQWIIVDDKTGKACILANMDIQFDITYNATNNKILTAKIHVPKNATGSGHCGNSSQLLGLHWNNTNYVSFTFTYNTTTKEYDISSIMANITAEPSIFVNSTEKVSYYVLQHNGHDFKTHANYTYECRVAQQLPMTVVNRTENRTSASLNFASMKINAFHMGQEKELKFDSVSMCEDGQTPDIVPIVVGCLLAALVILVLVGYLIGRRRSQARGYLSM